MQSKAEGLKHSFQLEFPTRLPVVPKSSQHENVSRGEARSNTTSHHLVPIINYRRSLPERARSCAATDLRLATHQSKRRGEQNREYPYLEREREFIEKTPGATIGDVEQTSSVHYSLLYYVVLASNQDTQREIVTHLGPAPRSPCAPPADPQKNFRPPGPPPQVRCTSSLSPAAVRQFNTGRPYGAGVTKHSAWPLVFLPHYSVYCMYFFS